MATFIKSHKVLLWVNKELDVYFNTNGLLYAPNNTYAGSIFISVTRQGRFNLNKDTWERNSIYKEGLSIPDGFTLGGSLFSKSAKLKIGNDVTINKDCCLVNVPTRFARPALGVGYNTEIGRNFRVKETLKLRRVFFKKAPLGLVTKYLLIAGNPFLKELPEDWTVQTAGRIFSSWLREKDIPIKFKDVVKDTQHPDGLEMFEPQPSIEMPKDCKEFIPNAYDPFKEHFGF